MTDTIPLRDHVERLIIDLERQLDVRRDGDQTALRLQAAEYERRLEVLNNDREEARDKEVQFALNKDLLELKSRVDIEFTDRGARTRALTVILGVGVSIAVVVGAVVAILAYAKQ